MSIRFESVSKSFGSKVVLSNICFEVKTGEIIFIIGKSGMGKSVTLKQIVGVMKPDQGNVIVEGQIVNQLGNEELSHIRKKCGMIFQHPALLDSLTIFENIAFGLNTKSEIEKRAVVSEMLSLVHLQPNILCRFPPEISYGMQKRVSLARTLAPSPSYLLFDEPTSGLDPITTRAINDLIFDLSRKLKVTSLIVSHDMGCALEIADRILVLHQGQILAFGTVEEIKKSKESLIQEFLSEVLAYPPLMHSQEQVVL